MLVGFKKATITVKNEVEEKVIVIEGKQNEGATTTAEITGLSPTPVRVAGSDIVYYISQRGTGEVAVNLGVLDLKDEDNDTLLGYEKAESGIAFLGRDTEAPECSLLLESSDLRGETALLGFFRGRFTKEAINLNTLDPSATFEPEAETYVFSAINDDKSGESEGQVLGKYVGSEQAAITSLRELMSFSTSDSGNDDSGNE